MRINLIINLLINCPSSSIHKHRTHLLMDVHAPCLYIGYVVLIDNGIRLVLDLNADDANAKDVIQFQISLSLIKDEETTVLPVMDLQEETHNFFRSSLYVYLNTYIHT